MQTPLGLTKPIKEGQHAPKHSLPTCTTPPNLILPTCTKPSAQRGHCPALTGKPSQLQPTRAASTQTEQLLPHRQPPHAALRRVARVVLGLLSLLSCTTAASSSSFAPPAGGAAAAAAFWGAGLSGAYM